MTIESVLIFSVIVEAIVICFTYFDLIIILLITKRLSELSTALKELMNLLRIRAVRLLTRQQR